MARFFDPATAPGPLNQDEWNEGNPYTLANVFRFAEPGEIATLWWYWSAPPERRIAGDIVARVLDPGGTTLAAGTLPAPAAAPPGWIAIPLRQPAKVHPDGAYLAAVSVPVDHRGNVHYASVPGLGRDGRASGPISAWTTADLAARGVHPGNGRFAPSADGFPNASFDDMGYGIDVSFEPVLRPRTLHVRQDGDDAGDGSPAAPWRTLPHAVALLAPGDTLLVGDGTWTEPITVAAAGTAAAPVVLRAATRHGAFLDVDAYAAIVVTGHHVAIEGLRIRNVSRHGIEGQGNHHMTVRDCLVHDCGGNGIGALKGDFYTFEDNLCRGNGRTGWNSGISIYQPDHRIAGDETTTERNVIRRNLCTDNHMLAFVAFTAGRGGLAPGDTVSIGAATARIDRLGLADGDWAAGTATGRLGLIDIDGPVRALSPGAAVLLDRAQRATLASGPFTDEGLFTDGNGIILDDWGWFQDQAAGYAYPFGATVEDNVCARNGGKGIQCYGVRGRCVVRNNTVWHNNRDAMQSGEMTWRGDLSAQDTAALFVNNIAVADPSRDGNVTAIGVYGGQVEAELVSNLTFDGTPGARSVRVEGATVTGQGNLFGTDPLLADPAAGDFRLMPASPARGAGTPPGTDLGARLPPG